MPAKTLLRAFDTLLGGEDRFRQVKVSLRREKEGALPVSLYGRREILTTSGWKRIIKKYNPEHLMEISDKVEQKLKMAQAGVPIPNTYMIVDSDQGIDAFSKWLKDWGEGFARSGPETEERSPIWVGLRPRLRRAPGCARPRAFLVPAAEQAQGLCACR